jgi:two-component system response regulator WspF
MRIAIVNDMMMAVEMLRRVVRSVSDYDIAWVARDGAEAVQKCAADPPDLVLMDLIMPVMDGVEATRRIMKATPCAILVVTASVGRNASRVFEAMGFGALDAVSTPALGPHGETKGGEALLAKIAIIGKLLGKAPAGRPHPPSRVERPLPVRQTPPLAVIGSSTGGPKALAKVLAQLPNKFGAAVVIIQHVDVEFAPGLAEWLDSQTPLKVRLASEGSRPEIGTVMIAGTNDHLILSSDLTLSYTPDPRDYPYRPSVDVFFESVAKRWPGKGIAVLLTGMGKDGASGLLSLRRAGWHTIAQDHKTSVVYGMPKAAAELGAAVETLPIAEIGLTLVNFFDYT